MMRIALLGLLVCASCKRGKEPTAQVSDETRPGPERGSAGGFSASLSADLEVRGPTAKSGSDFFEGSGSDSGSAETGFNAGASAGSASAGSTGAGSAGAGSGASGAENTGSG